MAETSRSRVTITLGRTGQVVKRDGPVLDSASSDFRPTAGTKRSVRDRLGSGGVDGTTFGNKRLRGEINILGTGSNNGVDDARLRKDDLRFKLNRRRVQSDRQHNGVDLREKLSRVAQNSTASDDTRWRKPEPDYARQRMPDPDYTRHRTSEPNYPGQRTPGPNYVRRRTLEPDYVRQRMLEPDHVRQCKLKLDYARQGTPEPDYARHRTPEPDYARQRISEPDNARQRMPEPNYGRPYMPVQKDVSLLGRVPSTRGANPLPQMDSLRDPYSPWTLDRLRRRSPEGLLSASSSGGLSPKRNDEELRRRPLMRTYDDGRRVRYTSKDILESSRPFGTAPYMSKPTAPARSMNPVEPLVPQSTPPSRVLQQSPYKVDERFSVDSLLRSLGLEKYAICFKAEEVDMTSLRQMGDNDLKDLGIPMGPRKKIMLALLSHSKRQ